MTTPRDEYFRDLPDPPPSQFAFMPKGPDWLSNLPPRIKDGQGGVDLRLVRDLARVGYKTYTIDPLHYLYKSMPGAIPVFTDWILHIDERIPEPRRTKAERDHKRGIWTALNWNLRDVAAKNNREAIDALFDQFNKPWCPLGVRNDAAEALDYITTKADYDRMVALLDKEHAAVRRPVIHYLGRFRTDRSHDLLVHLLHNDPETTESIITALARMKRPDDDIPLVRPYLDHPNHCIDAARAIKKLEKERR